jgi:branched-chain amino acid transport system substrate-binding protein
VTQLARRQVLQLLGGLGAAGLAAPVLAACGSSQAGGDTAGAPVRVGLLAPQSGVYKPIGDELTNGFRLYLALKGNVLAGHAVEVVTADEGTTVAAAKTALDKLVKEGNVNLLTGVASAAAMSGIRDQVEATQVPLLGSNGSPFQLGDPKYIWRTSYVDNEPGQALGAYFAEYLGHSGKVMVLADDSPSARDEVNGFLAGYQGTQGHQQLARDPITIPMFSNPNASPADAIQAVGASGVKTVFGYFSGQGGVNFVKAFRAALGQSVALYAPGFLTEGDLLHQEAATATGSYTSMNYSPDLDNDANRTFCAEYQKAYGRLPTTYAMASYDAAAVLEKALPLTNSDLSPQSINAALGRVGEIDNSPRGRWQFNQKRTPLQKWYLRQVRMDGAVLGNVLRSELTTLT